jgi:hydroxymethylglutaryl-CoA lyase
VNMMHTMGIKTGINLDQLCESVSIIAPHVSRPIDTGMYRLFNINHK